MKKILIAAIIALAGFASASAQKFALVDMDYILRNVPSYEMANEQLNQVSQRWEKEVEQLSKEAETMFKNYQSDMVFLTDDQKKKREEEIVAKEKEVTDTRYKYFYSGRRLQCHKGRSRREGVSDYLRQSFLAKHRVRFAAYRCEQRCACQARLFQVISPLIDRLTRTGSTLEARTNHKFNIIQHNIF